jgi:S-adenosylmethionine:tRNA ribosyltransferase-isomerase
VNLSDFDFDLPEKLIAQTPAEPRDSSRLFVLDKKKPEGFEHRIFRELPELLTAGDVLVLNETAVFPARLFGKREKTGGKVEVLLLEPLAEPGVWEALVRSKSTPVAGERLVFGDDALTFEASLGEGRARVRAATDAFEIAARHGHVPLPPYIRGAEDAPEDRERYQTVYARERGAVAAPTAGLHFTPTLLEALRQKGIQIVKLTLHVGLGTFLPVRAERIEDHKMHDERYSIPAETLAALEAARLAGRRIIACGTTSVRAIESFGLTGRPSGTTGIFIYPGFVPKYVTGMITNFHLPKSTLLMLVAAFAGRERILAAYAEAIARGYRFYSYGDAMLIV